EHWHLHSLVQPVSGGRDAHGTKGCEKGRTVSDTLTVRPFSFSALRKRWGKKPWGEVLRTPGMALTNSSVYPRGSEYLTPGLPPTIPLICAEPKNDCKG